MAFEADCNVSTVLEALRVARTARPLVLAARRLWASGGGWKLGDGKSEIRNPKSEIRNPKSEIRILIPGICDRDHLRFRVVADTVVGREPLEWLERR